MRHRNTRYKKECVRESERYYAATIVHICDTQHLRKAFAITIPTAFTLFATIAVVLTKSERARECALYQYATIESTKPI